MGFRVPSNTSYMLICELDGLSRSVGTAIAISLPSGENVMLHP